MSFIEKHHDRIVNIHVRDRKKNNGRNVPFGQGDTPIRDKKYPIRCYLEYEYGSFAPSVDEVKRCFDYCKEALA